MRAEEWDARYRAASGGLFGESPAEYVREIVARSDFRARSALLLADGDGRNGTWLAARGLSVTAVDLSPEATARARARDRAAGVAAERIAADLAVWAPPPGRRWGAAFIVALHGPEALRARALALAAEALAPGGWLVAEGFATAQAGRAGMGPDDPAVLWDLGWMRARLPGFRVIEAFAGEAALDEGPRHRGLAAMIRLAARREPGRP